MSCKNHPDYLGKNPPIDAKCKDCWKLYLKNNPNEFKNYPEVVKKFKIKPKTAMVGCTIHKSYSGKKIPVSNCKECWEFYKKVHGLNDKDILSLQADRERKLKDRQNHTNELYEKVEKYKEKLDNLKSNVDDNKIINVLLFVDTIGSPKSFSAIERASKRLGLKLYLNVQDMREGKEFLFAFTDLDSIHKLFYPYLSTQNEKYNFLFVNLFGDGKKQPKKYSHNFYNPDSGHFNAYYFEINTMTPQSFELWAERLMKETYVNQMHIKQKLAILHKKKKEE